MAQDHEYPAVSMNYNASRNNRDEDIFTIVCRACLQKLQPEATLVHLFESWKSPWRGLSSTVAEDLEKISNVVITQSDRYSKVICVSCCVRLEQACQFREMVQETDRVLSQTGPHSDSENWPKPIQVDNVIMDLEIKQEVITDEVSNENESIVNDNNVDIKQEPEDLPELSSYQITVNGSISMNEHNFAEHSMTNGNVSESNNDEESNKVEPMVPIKVEPNSDDENLPTDLPLECMLCSKVLKTISGLKAHVISEHSYKSIRRRTSISKSHEDKTRNTSYVCGTCKRKFTSAADLRVHETSHKAVCYGCNQSFDTVEQATAHSKKCRLSGGASKYKSIKGKLTQQREDLNDEEEVEPKEMLTCELCSETYSDQYYMRIHMEIHHSVCRADDADEQSETPLDTEALESIFRDEN